MKYYKIDSFFLAKKLTKNSNNKIKAIATSWYLYFLIPIQIIPACLSYDSNTCINISTMDHKNHVINA